MSTKWIFLLSLVVVNTVKPLTRKHRWEYAKNVSGGDTANEASVTNDAMAEMGNEESVEADADEMTEEERRRQKIAERDAALETIAQIDAQLRDESSASLPEKGHCGKGFCDPSWCKKEQQKGIFPAQCMSWRYEATCGGCENICCQKPAGLSVQDAMKQLLPGIVAGMGLPAHIAHMPPDQIVAYFKHMSPAELAPLLLSFQGAVMEALQGSIPAPMRNMMARVGPEQIQGVLQGMVPGDFKKLVAATSAADMQTKIAAGVPPQVKAMIGSMGARDLLQKVGGLIYGFGVDPQQVPALSQAVMAGMGVAPGQMQSVPMAVMMGVGMNQQQMGALAKAFGR